MNKINNNNNEKCNNNNNNNENVKIMCMKIKWNNEIMNKIIMK